jgi:hypothetical protein
VLLFVTINPGVVWAVRSCLVECLLPASQHHCWFFLLLSETWQKLRMQMFVEWFAWNLGLTNIYLFAPSVRSWWSQLGNHGSSSLLFTMKMMVWHVMINSHEVWSLNHCQATFQSLVVQFSPQSYRYCIICVLFLYHVFKVSATFLKLQDPVITDTAIAAQDFKNMWHALNKTCVCHASTRRVAA